MASVEKRIQEEILRDLDMTREISDEELLGIIRQKICDVGKGEYLSIAYRMELEHRIFYGLRRLDVLEDLLADDTITEIMVNGPDQIFIERNGCLEETKYHFSSNEKLDDVIQRIASANNKMANTSHPIVDTRLADGSRVNMVLAPIAVDHSVLSIRKFPKEQITMEKLIAWQALSQEAADFICQLVQSGYNLFKCHVRIYPKGSARYHHRGFGRIANVVGSQSGSSGGEGCHHGRKTTGLYSRPGQDFASYAPGSHCCGGVPRCGSHRNVAGI